MPKLLASLCRVVPDTALCRGLCHRVGRDQRWRTFEELQPRERLYDRAAGLVKGLCCCVARVPVVKGAWFHFETVAMGSLLPGMPLLTQARLQARTCCALDGQAEAEFTREAFSADSATPPRVRRQWRSSSSCAHTYANRHNFWDRLMLLETRQHLVTRTQTPSRPSPVMPERMGGPAVPPGSPSSELRYWLPTCR